MSGFGRILEDLNEAEVEYVLVGGIAMIRHGVVRATRDIDAVFDPTEPPFRSRGSGSAPTSKELMGFPRRSAHSPTSSP
jgi:hypothetical protein